jgi:hypothetical protein
MTMHDDAMPTTNDTRPLSAAEVNNYKIKHRSTTTTTKPDNDMITLSTIAHEMKMRPAFARARLRAAHIKHTSQGWRWRKNDPQLKVIRQILRD